MECALMAALGNIGTDMKVSKFFFSLTVSIPSWPDVSTAMPAGNQFVPSAAIDCEIVIMNDAAMEVLTV